MLKKTLVFLLLTFSIASLQGQKVTFDHTFYSVEDGLPANEVTCGLQAKNGFLWFGTKNGLCRFDGSQFKQVTVDNGLQKNHIVSIGEDHNGHLWILYGIYDGKLESDGKMDIYDPLSGLVTPLEEKTTDAPSEFREINYLLSDRDHNLYFVSHQNGVFKIDSTNQIVKVERATSELKAILDNNPQDIGYPFSWCTPAILKNRLISTNTYKRIAHFNKSGNKQYISLNENSEKNTLFIQTTFEDGEVDTRTETIDSLTYSILKLKLKSNTAIWLDPNSENILLPSKNGLFIYQDQQCIPLLPFDVNITSDRNRQSMFFFSDRMNNYWLCTYEGLHKFIPKQNNFRNQFDKLSYTNTKPLGHQLRSIIADNNDNIWVGGEFGLDYFDSKTEKYHKTSFPHHYSRVLKAFKQNNKITLFGSKILEFDVDKKEVTLVNKVDTLNKGFWAAHQISDSEYILAANHLIHYNKFTNEIKDLAFCSDTFPLLGITYRIVYDEKRQCFWAAGDRGMYKITEELCISEFYATDKNLPVSNQLPTSNFRDLYVDDDGVLWATTSITGLIKLDLEQGKHEIFSINEGMPSNNQYCILGDDFGNLWISTDKGLVRFDKSNNDIIVYNEKDGLVENEFNRIASFKREDGRMYFGSINGLTSFHPEDLVNDATDQNVPIEITGYHQYLEESKALTDYTFQLNLNRKIILQPGDRFFRIEFALLDYNGAPKQYRYKIKGFQEDWEYLKQGMIRMSGLPYGDFTLIIEGRSTNGVWSSSDIKIPIIVIKPYYLRWWAILSYAIIFFGALFYIRIKQVHKIKEVADQKRLKEIDELKTRLYTNITHEFRTPLTVIMGMANQISEENKEAKNHNRQASSKVIAHQDKIEDQSKYILRNADNLLGLINQMLDLSKLDKSKLDIDYEQGDIIIFMNYLIESFESYAKTKGVHINYVSSVETLIMDFDRKKMQQIISNLVSNAIKFAPKNSVVDFNVSKVNNDSEALRAHLKIVVYNEGSGIPEDKLSKIFDRFYQVDGTLTRQAEGTGIGLSLVKELTTLLGGEITPESVPNQGVSLTLLLPVTNKASRINIPEIKEKKYVIPAAKQADEIISIDHIAEDITIDTPLLLIVEDNTDVAAYIKLCMEDQYKIILAKNGQEGIDLAIEYSPNIIVSDVMMPIKDGYALAESLKKDARTSHIPIILLTAKSSIDSRKIGILAGADAYLSKPFDKEELKIRVAKLIESRIILQDYYSSKISASIGLEKTPNQEIELSDEEKFIQNLHQIFEDNLSNNQLDIPSINKKLGMSHSQVYRKVKALTGKTIIAHLNSFRLVRAKQLLDESTDNISEIAYEVGFSDPAYFSKKFSEEFGFPPSKN